MKITLLEPFYTSSHQQWADGLQKHSRHQIEILRLKGRHWKWRMHGGAVTLAKDFVQLGELPDLILATDMLDFSTFLGLTRKHTADIPTAIYFHENQITYPWSPDDKDVQLQRNNQYGFLNYTSALAADKVFFNSNFHKNAFLDALPTFLKQFPDYQNLKTIEAIASKSQTLHLGMDLKKFDPHFLKKENDSPILLWNHRWEYDKNPDAFFQLLFKLDEQGLDFQVIILGESYKKMPPIFKMAKTKLAGKILHYGYADSFEKYAQMLWFADIYPVTSNQDFFGGSVVEAIYCNNYPIMPNRLAYPEHLPAELRATHYYNSEAELFEKAKNTIQNIASIRQSADYQKYVGHYDWKNLIQHYDDVFEQFVAN